MRHVLLSLYVKRAALSSLCRDKPLRLAALRFLCIGYRGGFKNQHSCDAASVFLLCGRVHPVRPDIDCETVYSALNRNVRQLPEVIWIILLKDRDNPARAANINESKAGIELDDIRTRGQRQRGDYSMEIEHGKTAVALAGEESATMLDVERHAVRALRLCAYQALHPSAG